MKKIIATVALALALSAGIASDASAARFVNNDGARLSARF
jgi:hypothetical protein